MPVETRACNPVGTGSDGRALKLGVQVPLEEIQADEFQAMLIIVDERERADAGRLPAAAYELVDFPAVVRWAWI